MFGKKDNPVNVVVNQGGLVAVFDKANPPVVWRFDLQRNHSFAMRLKTESDGWDIGVSSPDTDFLPVAHFAQENDARQAFDAVQKTLSYKRFSKLWLGVKIVLAGIVLLFAMSAAWQGVSALYRHWMPATPMGVPMSADTVIVPPPAAKTAPKLGVPQSADDVLQVPQ